MSIRSFQRAFNGGIVSPSMYARIDDGKYQTGLAECKNFLVEPQGPLVARPGFTYVNKTKGKARLIPFTFSATQTMVLEFGARYVRFHTNGQTLLNEQGVPYEIETPYRESEIADIHYVQSADVVTLVHPLHPPMELRRYGATDWRLVRVNFSSSLRPPVLLSVEQTIDKNVTNPTAYSREYCVTALLRDGTQESPRSNSIKIACNPFGDGAFNTISWSSVSGAGLYRVYRESGGVWAYIGQTEALSMNDEMIQPDSSITPPNYDNPFGQPRGISSVTVTNGGSGYQAIETAQGIYDAFIAASGTYSFTARPSSAAVLGVKQTDHKEAGKNYFTSTIYYWDHPMQSNDAFRLDKWEPKNYYVIEDFEGTGAQLILIFNKEFTWRIDNKHRGTCVITVTLEDVVLANPGSGYVSPHFVLGNSHFAYRIKYYTSHFGLYDILNGVCNLGYWFPTHIKLPVVRQPKAYVVDPYGKGVGAELVLRCSKGAVSSIEVLSPGGHYENPQVMILGGGGKGAAARASVGATGDYPSAVSYFEQRRWFGGTPMRPSHLWATRSGTESDMSFSLPSRDDDRIAVRVAARESNRIQHIIPLGHLVLLTGAAEWRVSPINSDAITPASMSVRPQSYIGASNVQPVVSASSIIYAASRGGHLRELGFSSDAGGYVSGDVCLRAPHLFDNMEITDLAYSKAPWPIVWATSSSGKLIAMTYVPEQSVGAFSVVETKGAFESVCVVAEGEEDILYAVVRRTINGQEVRMVERMVERKYTTLEETKRLDCSGTYRGTAKTEIRGLDWLEGETVGILADGAVEPEQTVVNGKITLTHPASVVHVGLPYVADMKTLPIASQLRDGSFASGHKKNVRGIFMRVVDSSGVQAGPSFDELSEFPSRGTEMAGTVPQPMTDELAVEVEPEWAASGQVCVRQKYPLPLRIVSMTTDYETL